MSINQMRSNPRLPRQVSGALVLVLVAIFVGFIILAQGFYTVDAGQRAVVLQWGALNRVTGPGLHFKVPLVETVRLIDVRVHRREWTGTSMEAYSKDQQPAHLQVTVSYRVKSDEQSVRTLYEQFRNLDGFESSMLVPRAMEGIKTVFGQFNAVTVIQERTRFNVEVQDAVRKLITGPVEIEGVQIQDIAFSEAYEQSVEQRMQAQVEVERFQQNKAREQLQADIKVIQATAEAQSVKLRGDAEAAAIKARGDALRENPQLVMLTAAEKWNGTLPSTMVPGAAVPFIEVPGVPRQ